MNPHVIHRLKHYLEFFSQIPGERWCTGHFHDISGRSCALGHLGMHSGIPKETEGSKELSSLLAPLMNASGTPTAGIIAVHINDGRGTSYRYGKNPKTRIVNALKTCLEMETSS